MDQQQHHFLHHHHYHPQNHRTTTSTTSRYASLPSQSHHHNHHPPPPSAPPPPLSYHHHHHTPPTPQPHPFPSHHHPHRPLDDDHSLPSYDLLPRRIPFNPNPNPIPNSNPTPRDHFHRQFHHHRPPQPVYDTDRVLVVDHYDQSPAESFPWTGGAYHAPTQPDVDPKPYVRVYSVDRDDDADVANRNSRGESKRWVMSDRERGRELHESCSNLVNGGNDSEKYYHGSDMGNSHRYNNRVNSGREFGHGHGLGHGHGHEFARTPPKKQVQKKSALLRIQTVKPNHRNREIEQLRYPGYGNEGASGFFRGKEQYFGHGVKGEEREDREEREGSPVELDISFESNSLVAKAIVAPPSSSVSVPDLNETPLGSYMDLSYGQRSRRVLGSDGDGCSGLPPFRMSSVIVDLNKSPSKGNDSSGLGKEASAQKNVDDGSSRCKAGEADDSRGKNKVSPADDSCGKNKVPTSVKVGIASSGKPSSRVVKKKKIVKRLVKKATGNPKSAVLKSLPTNRLPGTVEAGSVALCSSTASYPEKIEANLDEKSITVDKVAEPDCLLSLRKEGSVLEEDKEGGSSLLSLGPDSRSQECKSEKDSDIGKVSTFEGDGNIPNSPSCASSSEYKKSDSDCLDANNSVHDNGNTISVHANPNTSDCLDADNSVPNTEKGTKSLNGTTISEVSHMGYDNKQLGQNEVSLSPQNYSNVGSPQNRNLVDLGDELFKSSDTFSSSGKTRIQDGLDCLKHASALKHSSDNGSSNLEDSICVHRSGIIYNAGEQVSPGDVIISPENCETEKRFPNSNISAGSGEGDTNEIKKRKASTQLNFLSSEMKCLSPDHVIPVGLANNVDGGSNLLLKEPCPSEVLDPSIQRLDFNSKSSLDGVTALHGKEGVLQAQVYVGNNDNDDANEVSPASKRKKVTANHPNFTQCQSQFSAEIVATTSSAEAPISFSDNQEHQKEVAWSSMGMGILSTAQSMPYSEDITRLSDNNLAGGSFKSIDANKEIMSSEYLELQHSDIVSSSPCEDLAFPNGQFSLLEGECKVNITPIVPISNTQIDVLAIGNIMGEKTDLQAVEENYQYSDFLQRSPRADMKPNDPNMKNELLAQQNLLTYPPSSDEVTTSNSNDELIEDAPGALSDMFYPGTAPESLDRRILESTAVHDENICVDEENLNNISMVEHGSDLNTFSSPMQKTKPIMKSDHAIGRSNLITKKTMLEPSQVSTEVTTQALNSYRFELSGTKNKSGGVIPKTFPGHSFTYSKSKTKTSVSSTHVSKPRTWHRTGNNPPTSLPRIKPSVGTVPPKRQIVERKGNFQSTSYVRKGNSLVRKPTPVSALPQISSFNQSTSLGLDEIPKSIKSESRADEILKKIKSESRADAIDQPMYLRTGASNAPQQRQRTPPPLSIDTKSEENTSSSLAQPPSGGWCESASDPRKPIEINGNAPNSSEDAPKHCETPENQAGPSDNGESQVEANNGNNFSLNTKRIVYIKPKTNQLVAKSNSSDVSITTDDNGQTTFSDGYYKRRKNQLVRTAFESHINQTVAMPNNATNSDGQGTSNALCNRKFSKKRSHKVARSSCKRSRASLVWTLCSKNSSENDRNSQHYQKVFPQLFPWKRTFLRSFIHNSTSGFNSSSLSAISKKLLHLRKRDTVYTRSTHGFSLWKSRVLGVGGCSLKWSKSIEKNSKQANEEATLAVAAVERKKREQKKAVCIGSQSKRERIFRIGSVRYRMDPSRRTLQRISDENDESLPSTSACSGLASKRAYIPRRLVIGNDEYVRIGNGNQLIRDPKKRTRKLANEKVRWSLHTARQRLARKQKYCQFFTRFGKCKKEAGKCPYIHDPSKIAVCTKFLNGLCSTPNCKLTHKVIPERMPDCSYFLQGLCSNRNCPYRHVNVNPKASICEGFLKGYCADGNECRKKHSYVCPTFEATGSCSQGTKCKLHHPKKQSKAKKRKRSEDQNNCRGRYFGSIPANVSESGMNVASKRHKHSELEEELSDYISLHVNEQVADTDKSFGPAALCDNDPLDLQLDDFDELIKPVLLLKPKLSLQSPQSSSLQA